MCGIAALVMLRGGVADRVRVERMGAALRHRGPDGEAAWSTGPVAMFHARLAVIDLANGAQPMTDGTRTITFNGEIYNYRELRTELITHGHRFRTTSDTEVLLAAWAQWGSAALARLNGMFAFVLHDAASGEVFLARDRAGIKPLYFTRDRDCLLAASEIKALLKDPSVRASSDHASLHEYLTFQFVLGDRTLFRDVHKVEPGCVIRVRPATGDLLVQRYWTPSYGVRRDVTEESATEELRALLEDAVALQLRADVPVGAHLSGGLDSSVLTALAAARSAGPMAAFTGRFAEGPEFDESHYARSVAQRHGVTLHEVVPNVADLSTVLPKLIWHLDEPAAGPGLIPQYAVSQLARRHVKVVLGGQGGDEVFGGYTRYLVAYLEQALKGAVHETNEEAEHVVTLSSILPNLPTLRQYVPMLQSFWSSGVFEAMDRRYFRLVDRSEGSSALYTPEFRASRDPEAIFARFAARFNHPETRSYYNKMTHFDLFASLPALLQVEDRVSMAVGLESRVPLLDHRLVEFVAALPPRLKFRGGELKYLFKRATRDLLPTDVLERKDKMGFPVPLQAWMRGGAREFACDTLLSTRARHRGVFDATAVEQLVDGEHAFGRRAWGLLSLELWFQTFIDS